MNPAYIGKKEINKGNRFKDQDSLPDGERYRLVEAVWEPVMDQTKFYQVQELIRKNGETRHNGASRPKHSYLLNHGLLWCGKCDSQMEGMCGTGRKGKKYYYYVCKNRECRFKVPADEIERLVLDRIAHLGQDENTLAAIVAATNERLRTELPGLRDEKSVLEGELAEVKRQAVGLINEWTSLATDENTPFLKEKLDDLGKRRGQLGDSLAALEIAVAEVERDTVDREIVAQALADFSEVFRELKPYRQKELMRLVLHKAILGPGYMRMALYGRPPEVGALHEGDSRFQTLDWLPGLPSQSALLWDCLAIGIQRVARGQTRITVSA